jgi:hypothetical protein
VEEKAMEIIQGHSKTGLVPEYWDGKAAERIVEVILDQLPKSKF